MRMAAAVAIPPNAAATTAVASPTSSGYADPAPSARRSACRVAVVLRQATTTAAKADPAARAQSCRLTFVAGPTQVMGSGRV